jgi:hypothetical protein
MRRRALVYSNTSGWNYLSGILFLAGASSPSPSSYRPAVPLTSSCTSQVRLGSYYANIGTDGDGTLALAREAISKEIESGKENSFRHMVMLVNIALGHYQKGDFATAKECAVYAHQKIQSLQKPDARLTYFSAKTAARCCRALRTEYQRYLDEKAQQSVVDELGIPRNKAHTPESIVKALETEEKKFSAHAAYIYHQPQNWFMRGMDSADSVNFDEAEVEDTLLSNKAQNPRQAKPSYHRVRKGMQKQTDRHVPK